MFKESAVLYPPDVTIRVTAAQLTVLSHPFDSIKFDELTFNACAVIISTIFADKLCRHIPERHITFEPLIVEKWLNPNFIYIL